jgi:hypothetical protein
MKCSHSAREGVWYLISVSGLHRQYCVESCDGGYASDVKAPRRADE